MMPLPCIIARAVIAVALIAGQLLAMEALYEIIRSLRHLSSEISVIREDLRSADRRFRHS